MPSRKTGKSQKRKAAKPKNDGTCFTIMPFGGWFDDYYRSIYAPAIKTAGLQPKRADDLMRPGTIVQDIWTYTKEAKIVLADLTGQNPNVFYELGLAHAAAKPAVLVTHSLGDVPFDLRALRVIEFDKSAPNWGTLLGEQIGQALREVLDAPVEAVLPAFLNVSQSSGPRVSEQQKELIEMRQDIERLRKEITRRGFDSRRVIPLTPYDAEVRIRRHLDAGMPKFRIAELLQRRHGVPLSWTLNHITRIQEQTTLPLEEPKKKRAARRKSSDAIG
jgi:hypothetical protein